MSTVGKMSLDCRAQLTLVMGLALVAGGGCGRSAQPKAKLVDVEGVVRINGQPAANVLVQFIPDITSGRFSPTSSGVSDASGLFVLKTPDGREGAVEGKHALKLVDMDQEDENSSRERSEESELLALPQKPDRIPARFKTVSVNSPSVQVKDGCDIIEIEIGS